VRSRRGIMRRPLPLSLCLVACLTVQLGGWRSANAARPTRATETAQGIDPGRLAGMKARSIGPAAMSGRVSSVAAVESNPAIIYVGGATSGGWKTTDGGLTLQPVFADQPAAPVAPPPAFH